MFLFLSKLLPLLIYPIGLSMLLLLLAMILIVQRKSRKALVPIALAMVLMLTCSSEVFATWISRSLESQNLPTELPKADAIVVLGGATHPQMPPRPWVEVNEAGDRVLYAAKLFREGKAPRIILSGGRIDWKDGGPQSEADDMQQMLVTMGVPATALLLDPASLNTRENAVNVQAILQRTGLKKILLVTSAIHMPRSKLIFKKLGMDVIPAPTDFRTITEKISFWQRSTEAKILALMPEADELNLTTYALKEYVGIWIYRLRGWV
jgi:uncharacterized SAM-binding protein YcdF (DUF218 family)